MKILKPFIILILFFLGTLSSQAQTTAIPDQQFEQILINEGIDSDGTLNGQVLTSDIAGVLNLDLQFVEDLTGLEDFVALESLNIRSGGEFFGAGLTMDLTANTNLKKVEITTFRGLSTLDVTGLTNLEDLILWEGQGDVETMEIDSLDLSTNTNIKKVDLGAMFYLNHINLNNENNTNMSNFELYLAQDDQGAGPFPDRPMCIKVDDATAAANNTSPYDSWTIYGIDPTFYDAGQCTLSVNNKKTSQLALYPNPATNMFIINSQKDIEAIKIYNLRGKLVKIFSQARKNYLINDMADGVYLVEITTVDNKKQLLKIIKE